MVCHPLTFNLQVSLGLKMSLLLAAYRWILFVCFLIYSDTMYLFIGVFGPLTFRVITERYEFSVIVLSVGLMIVVMSLVLCSLFSVPLTESPLGSLSGLV